MRESLFEGMEAASGESDGWHTAHCDGGSRGNPGPSGYGAVVVDSTGKTVARLSEFLGRQTNNYAEYKGLVAVIDWALQHGARRLRVVSDSELMVKQMMGQYKVASPGLRPLWEEARRLAGKLERFEIRHTLRGENKEADQLANDAMDKGMGKPPGAAPKAAPAGTPVAGLSMTDKKPASARQVIEGYVKGGVVHLLEGDLPDGTFVNVIPK